jgi:lysophospholipase L1-like esterase
MIIQPNSKLLMIGDSITDCERARPVGEGSVDALGKGYVSLVDGLLTASYPSSAIRLVNMGVSGNTVRDLHARWHTDVLELEPEWLSICIGINDVWQHFHSPKQTECHVSLDEYAQTLDELLQITRPYLNGLILITPYFIEPNRSEPMRNMMDQYGIVVRQLAERYQAVFVDAQAAFDAALKDLHPMVLAKDRVHPTQAGHMILARAFLKAIEYEWQ